MYSSIKTARQMQRAEQELDAFQRLLENSSSELGRLDSPGATLPDYWTQRRRNPRPSDKALTGITLAWLVTLPKPMQPHETVDRYPRVVNRIAECWNDPQAAHECFFNLLHDPRPGRKGFPAVVKRELKILRFLHATSMPQPATPASA